MSKAKTQPDTRAAYNEAAKKLADLNVEHTTLGDEIDAARAERVSASAGPSRMEDAAHAFLSSGSVAIADSMATLEAIDKLVQRRKVIGEAIKIQRRRVEELQQEMGREIAAAARPEYEKLVARMAEALVTLSAAADAEFALRTRLERDGVSFGAGVIQPADMSWARLSVYDSPANRWFNDVEAAYSVRAKVERQRAPNYSGIIGSY